MILTALLLAAQPAQAVAPPAPTADPDKKICRREIATGSMMAKKVCHTRAEWTRMGQESNEAAQRVRKSSNSCIGREC